MRKLILVALAFSLTACGPVAESPQSIAAKTLLTTRQAVIGAATATDALCKTGQLKQPECQTAKKAYEQFQVCYEPLSTAFLLYVQNGSGDYNKLVSDTLLCRQAFGGLK